MDMQTFESMLNRARDQRRDGDLQGAYATLRRAVSIEGIAYDKISKAADLFLRLRKQVPPQDVRCACKVAYLGSHTVVFHLPILQLLAWLEGILLEVHAPMYGLAHQEILNPSSALYEFSPDVVIIGSSWRDAHVPAFSQDPQVVVESRLTDIRRQWEALVQRQPCSIIQHNMDLPAWDSAGALGARLPGGRSAILRELNRQLAICAPPEVGVLDQDQVSAQFGRTRWQDDRAWHLAKQHPAHVALPDLARAQVALLRARLGMTKKVLVLDLDNTLWGGVIGEDGIGGIQLGPPDPRGEAHQEVQRYCLELKERGILLAVCSKNNEDDARLPFERHEASVLKLDDFAVFMANWNDKVANLVRMAKQLNLGLDSFVFLDDNPAERAHIRAHLPMVAVPELGADPSDFISIIDRKRYFEAWSLTDEDRYRAGSYIANAQREELALAVSSEADYLQELDMSCSHGSFDEITLPRIAQLVGKTNQFNLTVQRHGLETLRRFALDPQAWTQWFRLQDRFGDLGLVGVLVALPEDQAVWRIDTLLMSCRAMGRGMEHFMMAVLFREAGKRQIERLYGLYAPMEKNVVVADFYPAVGFAKVSDDAGRVRYELSVEQAPALITWVKEECADAIT